MLQPSSTLSIGMVMMMFAALRAPLKRKLSVSEWSDVEKKRLFIMPIILANE